MIDPLDLTHTKKALEDLDAFNVKWDKAWENPALIDNRRAKLLFKTLTDAENEVRKAFFEDTKDRNSLDNCMLVGISWLRKIVKEN